MYVMGKKTLSFNKSLKVLYFVFWDFVFTIVIPECLYSGRMLDSPTTQKNKNKKIKLVWFVQNIIHEEI